MRLSPPDDAETRVYALLLRPRCAARRKNATRSSAIMMIERTLFRLIFCRQPRRAALMRAALLPTQCCARRTPLLTPFSVAAAPDAIIFQHSLEGGNVHYRRITVRDARDALARHADARRPPQAVFRRTTMRASNIAPITLMPRQYGQRRRGVVDMFRQRTNAPAARPSIFARAR